MPKARRGPEAPSPALRAVFFDVDDTLYSTTAFATKARRRAVESMVSLGGLQVTADQLLAELKEVIAEFGPNYDEHYDRLLRRYRPEELGGHSRSVLVAAGVAAYHDTKVQEFTAFPGVLDGLRALSGRTRLVLGVITEGLEVKQAEKIHRLGVYPFLDRRAVLISDVIGISKPNPKLWLRACEATGVPPAESLYVGDNPVNDIVPARSVGMRTVRMRSPGGKYAAVESPVPPDHEVRDFPGLIAVLRDVYAVGV
jgi:putative hydrolase of the HAD superfamily